MRLKRPEKIARFRCIVKKITIGFLPRVLGVVHVWIVVPTLYCSGLDTSIRVMGRKAKRENRIIAYVLRSTWSYNNNRWQSPERWSENLTCASNVIIDPLIVRDKCDLSPAHSRLFYKYHYGNIYIYIHGILNTISTRRCCRILVFVLWFTCS